MPYDAKQEWEEYCARELSFVAPILEALGYTLEEAQPHLEGERYLMQAVTTTSGKKLILLAHEQKTGRRVVIKATSDRGGIKEIEHERTCRQVLQEIRFAYSAFLSPEEILFTKQGRYVISIQVFIEQESTFLTRPLKEQFMLALRAFKAQESAHATTYEHTRIIKKTFGSMEAKDYTNQFQTFTEGIFAREETKKLASILCEAKSFLESNKKTIEQYGGFLTHTDFVPHNFRIKDNDIYLLDHSSLRFGNKYEGWARFLNFMTLYNPALEKALIEYIHENRTPEESLSLKLMRIYRLGEIIWYYTRSADRSTGDLYALNTARVGLWASVLESVLRDTPLESSVLEEYKTLRDSLRSEDEKRRQKDLH